MDAAKISRTGLDVEWQRLQVIAQNLASVDASRTASGAPVRAMRLISGPIDDFGTVLSAKGGPIDPKGVRVFGVEAAPESVRRVYDPSDPQADAQGFVSHPAIDHAGEMTLLIRTSRAYEADLTVMSIADKMDSRALDLGRNS
ncbi:MAG: flagellar basal body rod C-terminal domain-containing protein [Sphingomonas sp.]